MNSKESYRNELRAAIRHLSDRCLYSASKWAAEQLVGIEPDRASKFASSSHYVRPHHRGSGSGTARTRRTPASVDAATTPVAGVSYVRTPIFVEEEMDGDYFLLAKSYFDCREYRRAAHVLRDQAGKKANFLRCYALYLAGEKRKEEEVIELEGPLGKSDIVNRELASLKKELSGMHKSGSLDAFGLYVYAIVLRENGCEDMARSILVDSVNIYPWNWSAWSDLQSLCTTPGILGSLTLKNHWMKDFFLASAYQELKMFNEALAKYSYLQGIFRFSDYIQTQIAIAHYSLRELDDAEILFEEVLRNDPYRVDSMDVYSNVLYAKESFSALSFLAHRVFMSDKYRPESCCIIGNYFSSKAQHEKSILYFRRALKLNSKYLSAWTLMGHEYLEMKNTPAATDAYRRAVEINPRDFRAWYGLGQTYEIMAMPYYALHYYSKSAYLQPRDDRLWIAMAQCYQSELLNMPEEAIKCYKRAANCDDNEGVALYQIAKLNRELGHSDEAAFYYKKDLEKMEADERTGPNMVEALHFLASYCKSLGKFDEAKIYYARILDYNSPEEETPKNLVRETRTAQPGQPSMDIEHFVP